MRSGHRFALGFLVAYCLALPARILTGANVWTIPGTVNAAGQNNTRFVSDLAVTNPGIAPAQLTISLIPARATTPSQVTLAAGETIVYRNVLDRVWGAQGPAATKVTSEAPLLIRARTYNTAATGTYGVALPVFADERLLVPGQTANSLWISQSADGSSGYRTNVAVVFPDDGGGSATVTIFDAEGNDIGSQDFALDAAGFRQFSVSNFADAVVIGRAEVQVTRGRAAGYSVVVDNVTGDSSLFSFEELPTGYQDVVVNGVARANGRNSTFFRTDGRFFNPTDEDAVVKVSFHASGTSNPAPVSRTFTVGGGRLLDVVDVLGSLLDLPVGSSGALRFETDAPVGILCRTSNVDPTGVKPGTFGAQQKPVPLLSFLMSADAPAVVTGIRQDTSFRTNVGFAAGPDGASYALTLKNTAGGTVATATDSLGPSGWKQPNVQDLFPGTTIPGDATLQVTVTSGSLDVFDSSIDNASGDSVVTPVMPLPVNIPSSATIGPQGGSVRSDDGRITLKVPAGALAEPVTIALAPDAAGDPKALGSAYALTPSPLPLAKPALLVFRAAGGPAPALGLVSVSLAVKTGSGTFVAMGGRVDPVAGTLSVPISSTSPSLVAGGASGRVALDNLPAIVAVLNNVIVVPEFPTVLTDGDLTFSIAQQLPPSAGEEDIRWLSSAEESEFTVRWTRPRRGTIDSTTDKIVRYKAPHRIPMAVASTNFWVTIRASGRGFNLRFSLPAQVLIVRRNWELQTEATVDLPCEAVVTRPYSLTWKGRRRITFSIGDNYRITKTSDSLYEADSHWDLCPAPYYAFTNITATGADHIDAGLDILNGAPLSLLDVEPKRIVLSGYTQFMTSGAILTGPQVSPLDVSTAGEYVLGFLVEANYFQEGVWFVATTLPHLTHRIRFWSVPTP